jgi:hypothetical protein
MGSEFAQTEAAAMTVRAGNHLLGLRASTPELASAARAILRPGLVTGLDAPTNVSIVESQARAGRPLYFCYRSGRLMVRARSARRAMEGALAMLSSYGTPPAGLCRIAALVAIREGEAALLCPDCHWHVGRLQPRLRAAGWHLVDSWHADLDPITGEVIIAPLLVSVDRPALEALDYNDSDSRPPAPGRYPVRVWIAAAHRDAAPESAAARVVEIASGSHGLHAGSLERVLQTALIVQRRADWAETGAVEATAIVRTLTATVP